MVSEWVRCIHCMRVAAVGRVKGGRVLRSIVIEKCTEVTGQNGNSSVLLWVNVFPLSRPSRACKAAWQCISDVWAQGRAITTAKCNKNVCVWLSCSFACCFDCLCEVVVKPQYFCFVFFSNLDVIVLTRFLRANMYTNEGKFRVYIWQRDWPWTFSTLWSYDTTDLPPLFVEFLFSLEWECVRVREREYVCVWWGCGNAVLQICMCPDGVLAFVGECIMSARMLIACACGYVDASSMYVAISNEAILTCIWHPAEEKATDDNEGGVAEQS